MKKTFIAMLAVTVLLLALALTINYVLLWRLFLASSLILLAGAAWTFIGSRGVHGSVTSLPDHCQAGDALEQVVTLQNRGPLLKLLEVAPTGDLPGPDGIMVMALDPGSEERLQSRLTCERRGIFHAGALRVAVRDPFGLFMTKRAIGASQHITVYPATVPLPYFSPLLKSNSGIHANRWLDTGASQDASRIREYTSGDSLNRIHWRATAHNGNLMVKVFDPYRSSRAVRSLWVAVDLQANCQAGSGRESTEEYGVTIAASIIDKFHGAGLATGLILSLDKPIVFPPQNGDTHLRMLMEALATVRANGRASFEQAINQHVRYLGPDSVVVAVTSSDAPGVDTVLRQVAGRGLTTAAVMLDASSFGGTHHPGGIAHRLAAGGVQVHIVRQGDNLGRVLDSRASSIN